MSIQLYSHPLRFPGLHLTLLQICMFSKNKNYTTWTLQWLGASKLFDNTNRSVNHTAWCSRSWRIKGKQLHITVFLQTRRKKKKKKKNTPNQMGIPWWWHSRCDDDAHQSQLKSFCRFLNATYFGSSARTYHHADKTSKRNYGVNHIVIFHHIYTHTHTHTYIQDLNFTIIIRV